MPILSIVVPTHERAKYAIPTIRCLLEAMPADVEVVVPDTSKVDLITPALQHEPGWDRVRLVRPTGPLSVVDNFNKGLRHASGRYLLFIGDDDFVNPTLMDVLRQADREQVDAITFSTPALYFWPDFLHKRRDDFYAASLQIHGFTGSITPTQPMEALRQAADDLGGGVGDMPRAYAGVVSRSVVDRAISKFGPLFGGVSPDIYSAALIATEAVHCIRVDYPLVIPGSSLDSTSGLSARGHHVGKLRSNAHISAFKNLVWNPLVPEFYSVPTVWGYTLIEALKLIQPPVPVNLGRMFARCIFYHRPYWAFTARSLQRWAAEAGWARVGASLAAGSIKELGWIVRKVYSLARHRLQPSLTHEIRQQPDSLNARRALSDWLRDQAPALKLPPSLPGPRRVIAPLELTPQGRPLLSIVLPSCNRQAYLKPVLRTLLEVTAAELVVSDNSDAALTEEELAALQDGGRLIYQHVEARLSVVENFERGLHLARGEYLLFLGDDDCVGPGIENLVRWARDQGIEALISYGNRFIANYYWPGVKSKYFDDGYAGKLFVNRFGSRAHTLDGPHQSWLASRNPGGGLGRMPRAYHGVVSRALIERVLQRHGRLFGGVSPDVYSATLISHEVKRFVAVDYPFVIPGGSAPSTAGEGAARSDVDKLDAREHIKRFGDDLVWDARIPSFYSPITVWAYSQQMALHALGGQGADIDFPRLYLKCLLYYPRHRQATAEAIRHWLAGRSAARLVPSMAWGLLLEARQLMSRVWFRFVIRPESHGELAQIGAAYRELERRVPPWRPPGGRHGRRARWRMSTTPHPSHSASPGKTLVVSAVNLVEGGTLKVLKDCVAVAATSLPGWRIVVLAHRRDLITTPGVEVVELPHIKPRWWRRLWAEWHQFHALSADYRPDLWLSLHDITPRVQARRQVVYCHNPAPFWQPTWRDAWYGPDYWLFAKFYGLMYRAFIGRNHAVIVQQAWLRDEFRRRWNAPNVIVARPEMHTGPTPEPRPLQPGQVAIFLYPALPRCFKNFEVIGEALELLEADPHWSGEVRWTLTGTENRYARWLKQRFGHLRTLRWIGLQTRDQMQQQYRESQCLIFPSRLETWGLPITEAKQHGLAILAADLPYAYETVGDCDAVDFFAPDQPAALAERMKAFAKGQPTTHAVKARPVAEPFVSDWPQLLARLTDGL